MAAKGYKKLSKLIKNKEFEEIAELLRDHKEGAVYEKELKQRFEIDTLIEFYNLLLIAALAGYIPAEFEDALIDEIETI
ncbi:hypothetical protein, partial [Rhizobium leguminosarum]|uniref:hypothetical protein n=1 Tax=Rhizobium leguminosarum TaxID=384 RepID=UPI003F9B6563